MSKLKAGHGCTQCVDHECHCALMLIMSAAVQSQILPLMTFAALTETSLTFIWDITVWGDQASWSNCAIMRSGLTADPPEPIANQPIAKTTTQVAAKTLASLCGHTKLNSFLVYVCTSARTLLDIVHCVHMLDGGPGQQHHTVHRIPQVV